MVHIVAVAPLHDLSDYREGLVTYVAGHLCSGQASIRRVFITDWLTAADTTKDYLSCTRN